MKWYNEYNTITHKLKARDNLKADNAKKWERLTELQN